MGCWHAAGMLLAAGNTEILDNSKKNDSNTCTIIFSHTSIHALQIQNFYFSKQNAVSDP